MAENYKQTALQFLSLVVVGNIDEAYQKYVNMDGKHHNTYFPAGFVSLREAMKENHLQFPDKKFTVKNALGDGDLVAVHSHLVMKIGGPELLVVHLFRFKDDKIVEIWDCGQAIPDNNPNKDGAF
jgi:predicted SnoaL-like aldol condensation-catalyzing enzyme